MKKLLIIMVLLSVNSFTWAKDIKLISGITQSEFESFVKEFGTASLFNPMTPAEPLGLTGFDISVEGIMTDINDSDAYWKKFFGGEEPYSYIPASRLHVQKGMPFGMDVGAMYVAIPGSNIKLWGLEAKYTFFEGNVITPALSTRLSYSSLLGVDDISLNTMSLDLLISKGFMTFTPYAGISLNKIDGNEQSDVVILNNVEETQTRLLLGVQFSLMPLLIIDGEVSFGEVPQYGLKFGFRF